MNQVETLVKTVECAFPVVRIEQDGNWLDVWIVPSEAPAFTIEVSELHQAYGLHYKPDPSGMGRKPDEAFNFHDIDKLITRMNELVAQPVLEVEGDGPQYPDNCQACFGASGGVRGNENRVNGLVLCDYCDTKATHGVLKSPEAPKDFKAARSHNEYVWAGLKCLAEACPYCAGVPTSE